MLINSYLQVLALSFCPNLPQWQNVTWKIKQSLHNFKLSQCFSQYLTEKNTRPPSPLSFHGPAPTDSHSTSCFCGFSHQDSSYEREHILKYVGIFVCVCTWFILPYITWVYSCDCKWKISFFICVCVCFIILCGIQVYMYIWKLENSLVYYSLDDVYIV